MSTWTDRRGWSRPGSKEREVQDAVYALLNGPKHKGSGALPTSLRFLFYELVQLGTISKRDVSVVSEATMLLRRSGDIPWDWIVDETRTLHRWSYHESIRAGVVESLARRRLDCWAGDPPPLVLTESSSLAGVLETIAATYLASIAATRGQVGGFLYTSIIPALNEGQRVLYFGDLDLAGRDIEANTRRVIEDEVGELQWERMAITLGQVGEHNVPSRPKTDRRFKDPERGTHDAYETEALSQTVIQQLLIDRLEELLPQPLKVVRRRERTERADIIAALL